MGLTLYRTAGVRETAVDRFVCIWPAAFGGCKIDLVGLPAVLRGMSFLKRLSQYLPAGCSVNFGLWICVGDVPKSGAGRAMQN